MTILSSDIVGYPRIMVESSFYWRKHFRDFPSKSWPSRFRGRRSIWWGWRVTWLAPRIGNDVSYVTQTTDDIDFVWQVQYLVRLEGHFVWQAQYLVRLAGGFSWQAQHFVTFWEIAGTRNVVFYNCTMKAKSLHQTSFSCSIMPYSWERFRYQICIHAGNYYIYIFFFEHAHLDHPNHDTSRKRS